LSKSSEIPHLNELRNLRDVYLEKAVLAMAKTYSSMTTEGWRKWFHDMEDKPDVMIDGLKILLDDIFDFYCWAMITRFHWLCVLTRAEEFRQLQLKRHLQALSR